MKSNWNVFIAVCVGAVAGFAVGQHMGSKGGSLGTPLRNAPQAARRSRHCGWKSATGRSGC